MGLALKLKPHVLASKSLRCGRLSHECSHCMAKEGIQYDSFWRSFMELLVAAVAHPAGGNDHALAERIATKHRGQWLHSTIQCTEY